MRAFQKRKKLPAIQVADLNAFLATFSPGKDVKPRKIGYKPKVLTSFDGGNADAGKKNIVKYCAGCHGDTDDHIAFELKKGRVKKAKIASKVRGWIKRKDKLVFKANNGMMSFFATDRLPDKDLLDIIAYVGK